MTILPDRKRRYGQSARVRAIRAREAREEANDKEPAVLPDVPEAKAEPEPKKKWPWSFGKLLQGMGESDADPEC